ncbi:MAG: SDR family NAD(P)-dependent oxidoreductase, partial [Aristaeellaceae bacterium]
MHEFSFQNKTAVITGGARGIGRCIAEEFVRHGAQVHVIDIAPGEHYVGDISDPAVLEAFVKEITRGGARIDYLINNALPEMHGIDDCSWEQFNYALQVGVAAPFYLTKLLLPHFAPGAAIVNISSTRDRMSQPQTESYTA